MLLFWCSDPDPSSFHVFLPTSLVNYNHKIVARFGHLRALYRQNFVNLKKPWNPNQFIYLDFESFVGCDWHSCGCNVLLRHWTSIFVSTSCFKSALLRSVRKSLNLAGSLDFRLLLSILKNTPRVLKTYKFIKESKVIFVESHPNFKNAYYSRDPSTR